jgi:hypothetical protein
VNGYNYTQTLYLQHHGITIPEIQILFMLKIFWRSNSYLMGTCFFCNGPAGTEINSNGTDVWNTTSPITSTGILKQGVVVTQNSVFWALYPKKTYSGFS